MNETLLIIFACVFLAMCVFGVIIEMNVLSKQWAAKISVKYFMFFMAFLALFIVAMSI